MLESPFTQTIVLHIHSRQETDGEVRETDITSRARYTEQKGAFVLEYDEPREDGSFSTTTLTARPNSLFLARTGEDGIHIMIEKGHMTASLYNTPVGELTLLVYPQKVDMRLARNRGNMELSYVVDYAGERSGNHAISVSWQALK
ncbi:MAG: DUF1934 domain-containing protein [Christensenellales bacterium]|jgi:uncharacterized beta-barrel protein YwiB (DUF1934 family)